MYFCGKIVDKRAYLPAYLSSSALSAYLRVIKIKINKQQNWEEKNLCENKFSRCFHQIQSTKAGSTDTQRHYSGLAVAHTPFSLVGKCSFSALERTTF